MGDYVAMLSEDANKILEKMVKEFGNQIIDECVATASFPSLPLLPESNKDIPSYEGRLKG
jgi:hypothetical protein